MITQIEIDRTAARLRELGVPDMLNRWIGLTPERVASGRTAITRMTTPEPIRIVTTVAATKATQPAAAAATKESTVKTNAAKKSPSKRPSKPAKAAPRQKAARSASRKAVKGDTTAKAVRPGSKLSLIVNLLQRKEGCTAAEVLKVTKWPAVSMPQQAKAAGIELATEKEGRTTRYWSKAFKPETKKAD